MMRHPLLSVPLAAALAFLAGCSSSSPTGSGSPGADGGADGGAKIFCDRAPGSDTCTCIGDESRVEAPAECSTSSPANSFCCADPEYPSNGTCQCEPWACSEGSSNSLCLCGLADRADPAATQCIGTPICCEDASSDGSVVSCSCKRPLTADDTCAANERAVPSCDVSAARCRAGQLLVRSCTP